MRRVSKRVAATMATSSSSQNTPAPTTNSTMNTRNDPNLPFDLSTVKTIPDENIVRTKGKRIFGIQEAPTFYPTKEEFQDPLKYIEKISPQGEQYGIIKIVPPKDYKPEFSLKTENFRFKTRIQKLNSMEGETRTNVNYLEQLTKYHILAGKPVGKIPQLDKRPIDLYKLKNEVALRGGVQEVTRLKKWAEIGRVLGYARKQCTSMSNALKTAYQKVILPYEIWYAKHKEDVGHLIKKEDTTATATNSLSSTLSSVDSNSSDSTGSDTCEICQKNENEEQLLLCDGCNRGYHMYCLTPPLPAIPKTDWYCLQCLTAVGKDYGFEDGEEYSLADFHKVCDKFKSEWFSSKSSVAEGAEIKTAKQVTEEECENEFWRLVENPHETCEVEYGADLHSTQHGSGFMAAEQMPKGAFDPWNLNVIPVAPQSLFTHIKTDISGMMIPWLYVGMCFSAFCWHNEDHYTYSINYMHWGETKTWYGVPGSDTHKFEETMRKAVPELFEQQPDLLFQLVTMLSPGRLLKEDVNVYAVDQRPGQFVVTFPKAYHSGFNHGFNFCEAVNFAPSEWVDHGLECVKRYKAFRRQPCFSHDELLVTAAQNMASKPSENMDWLKEGLNEMLSREISERNAIRTRRMKESILEAEATSTREELQCVFCNCYTYLSYVGCECTTKVSCLDHITELCTCDLAQKTLYLRFTDKQLDEMTKKVLQSGLNPDDWLAKLNKSMTTKPTLKALRELLREGQEHNVPQYHLDTLRDYIETVDNWTNDAERLLLNKSESKPTTKRRDQRVRDLIEQATQIGFDMPHLDQLVEYSQKLDTFNNKLTDEVLSSTDKELQMQLYQQGLQLRADSIKFNQLKNSLESCSWEEQVEKAVKQPFSQKVFKKLIKDAEDLGKTEESEPWLKRLIIMEENGRDILQRVENICKGKDKIVFDEEESILHMGENTQDPNLSIILDTTIINRLKNAMGRSKNVLSEIENMLLNASKKPNVMDRPSLTEAQRLMSMCRELSFKSDLIPQLSNALTQMGAWNDQLRSTFMNGRQKSLETVIRESLSNVERITSSEATAGIWCICRRVESGLMIECDICREWYHSSCLKVPRNVVRSSTNYVCPVCHNSDQRARITHLSRQPKLEEIADLVNNAQPLKFKPKDYNLINAIHTTMQAYKGKVRAFCRSKTQLGMEDVGMIKHYLRTLMGLEISLQDETEFLRTKIQKLMPITPTPNQTTGTGLPAASNSVESTSAVKPASASSSKVVVENDDAATGATAPATTTPEHRRLTTTVRPLSNNHHQLLPQQSSNCICQQQKNMDDSISKCPHCTGTAGPSSAETHSPRLTITATQKRKSSTEELLPTSPKPQKIIKLTVKPPTAPSSQVSQPSTATTPQLKTYSSSSAPATSSSSSNNKKRPYSPAEEDQHASTKKHRPLSF